MDASERRPHPRADEGFTLVEVVVAMVVITVALLALAAVQAKALSSVVLSEERQQATGYSNALIEVVRASTSDTTGFRNALAHATNSPKTPVKSSSDSVSGTVFTTAVRVARATLPGRTAFADDLIEVSSVTTWTSRNDEGRTRAVTTRTLITKPVAP